MSLRRSESGLSDIKERRQKLGHKFRCLIAVKDCGRSMTKNNFIEERLQEGLDTPVRQGNDSYKAGCSVNNRKGFGFTGNVPACTCTTAADRSSSGRRAKTSLTE
jgi:hypothetical protein